MSKSRYLKASELKIPHKELRAMIWVLKQLWDGTIGAKTPTGRFNILHTVLTDQCDYSRDDGATLVHWCGTVACIGGWIGLKMYAKDPFKPTYDESNKAKDYMSAQLAASRSGSHTPKAILFYNNLETKNTPVKAAKALEEYLQTGVGR